MNSSPLKAADGPLSAEIIVELPPRPPAPPPPRPRLSQPRPSQPRPSQPRFSLWAMMVFMTGCCVLLGGLAALKVPIWGVLVGFLAIPLFCLAVIGLIELGANRKDLGRWE